MVSGWQCIKLGSAAIAGIVPVAPWMIAAYLAVHPLPADCDGACHFVIPAAEFRRGGMFGPGAKGPAADAAPMPDGFAFAGDWAPDGLPATLFLPDYAGWSGADGDAGGGPRGGRAGGGAQPGWSPGFAAGTAMDGGAPRPRPGGQARPRQSPGGDTDAPAGEPVGNNQPAPVPEPAAAGVLLAALLCLAAVRRRISPCRHRVG